MSDFAEYMSKWEEERKQRKAQAAEDFRALCSHHNIAKVVGEFSGSCDSGCFDSILYFDSEGNQIDYMDKEADYAFESFLVAYLPAGWEINDGSDGTITALADGTVSGEIGWNVISKEYEVIG